MAAARSRLDGLLEAARKAAPLPPDAALAAAARVLGPPAAAGDAAARVETASAGVEPAATDADEADGDGGGGDISDAGSSKAPEG